MPITPRLFDLLRAAYAMRHIISFLHFADSISMPDIMSYRKELYFRRYALFIIAADADLLLADYDDDYDIDAALYFAIQRHFSQRFRAMLRYFHFFFFRYHFAFFACQPCRLSPFSFAADADMLFRRCIFIIDAFFRFRHFRHFRHFSSFSFSFSSLLSFHTLMFSPRRCRFCHYACLR